ncbi:hypothetical protein CAEBREN_03814 [Caenorhabditis brenneri]|uniref:Uncharacterized protein n=1 Tax=Caenorhabditis brenneri TaxID=135651 RepID=G0MLQ7_CAEBE|nr:hypothetical protein CAEBREN_03814 [Caenorhabditis brenneri]
MEVAKQSDGQLEDPQPVAELESPTQGAVDKEVDGSEGSMEDADQPLAAGNETSELEIRLLPQLTPKLQLRR